MSKKSSPMVQTLISYGTNCIAAIKNNDKDTARTLLNSMVTNINQYHLSSLYAIQYDIYNYMHSISKSHKSGTRHYKNTDSECELCKLELAHPKNIKMPDDAIYNDVDTLEDYINMLIKHTKDYEKGLCNQRNNYINSNLRALNQIAATKTYDACSENKLKSIVKYLVPVLE